MVPWWILKHLILSVCDAAERWQTFCQTMVSLYIEGSFFFCTILINDLFLVVLGLGIFIFLSVGCMLFFNSIQETTPGSLKSKLSSVFFTYRSGVYLVFLLNYTVLIAIANYTMSVYIAYNYCLVELAELENLVKVVQEKSVQLDTKVSSYYNPSEEDAIHLLLVVYALVPNLVCLFHICFKLFKL
jgi:hypothetical protein